jgi:hypothetical protein
VKREKGSVSLTNLAKVIFNGRADAWCFLVLRLKNNVKDSFRLRQDYDGTSRTTEIFHVSLRAVA